MLRRVSRVLLALFLAWSLLPGGGELLEQAAHLVSNGHLAHLIPGDPDEQPAGPEHDCQGLMHLCHCHSGPGQMVAIGQAIWMPPPALLGRMSLALASHDDPPSLGVFHPPKLAPFSA